MDVKLKPYKKEFTYSYAFGVFPTIELLMFQREYVVKVILHTKGALNEGVSKIKEICKEHHIPIEIADRAIEKMTSSENSYAVGIFKKYTTMLDNQVNHLVLVNPGDKGNIGTIIRTMLGFDINNLVLIKPAVDIFDPKVIRASMGAFFQLKFAYFEKFTQYQEAYSRNNYPFITNAMKSINSVTFKEPFSLIFGNESSGLGEEYLKVGVSVKIPQTSRIDSFSLPIAAGVAMYETYQRVSL